jgi:hypothetical protein
MVQTMGVRTSTHHSKKKSTSNTNEMPPWLRSSAHNVGTYATPGRARTPSSSGSSRDVLASEYSYNNNTTTNNNNNKVNNNHKHVTRKNQDDFFVDDGIVVGGYGQGHCHGAAVYDDWGLPISNPTNFRQGRNAFCRPWLILLNLVAMVLLIGILMQGGPSYSTTSSPSSQQQEDVPDTTLDMIAGPELIGPIPERNEAESRMVGYGHHVVMSETGDRIAVARASGHFNESGQVFVYSNNNKSNKKNRKQKQHKHVSSNNINNDKWQLEQILTAELEQDDLKQFHTGQQHSPLAMSASGDRIAFTEGDHVFIFESSRQGVEWKQIAKLQSLDEEWESAQKQKAQQQQQQQQQQEHPEEQATAVTADDDEDEDDDDDDAVSNDANTRRLAAVDWGNEGSHFGKHLAFSHDGKTLAVMGFNNRKGGYVRVFYDETADIHHKVDHDEIQHLFEPTPDIFLQDVGDALALSGDGKKLAIGIATSRDALHDTGNHNGVVEVFAMGTDYEWYRIGESIFGDHPMEGFGGALSLSEDGMVLAAGVVDGGGPVKIFELIELDHFGRNFHWQQMGQTLLGNHPKEHFGSQVRLDHDGAFVAIGAPGSPDMLNQEEPIEDNMERYLHGKAYLFGFNRESHKWENIGEATSTYEGDGFGYSVAIDGDGDRVIVGAPFRIVSNEVNVGVVQTFGTKQV